MGLDKKHVGEVCGIGKGARTCSFLTMAPEGWECAKGTSAEQVINARREAGTMNAAGNNCSGPPDFKPTNEELKFN